MAKSGIKKSAKLHKRAFWVLLLLTAMPFSSKGMNHYMQDCIENQETANVKKDNLFWKVVNFVDRLIEQDTFYVSPNKYNLTITPQYTFGYEYYRFATENKKQSITISPTTNNKIGVGFGWRWLSAGYSFTLDNIQPEFDMELNLYCSRAGLELFYRKRSDGFKIRGLKGFYEDNKPITGYNADFNGLTTSQIGANAFYVFNYRKFSFPAAFSHSTNQRVNAGSFILGLSYNEQKFMFDHTQIDPRIESLMSPELRFKNVDYKDFSISFGYSYNWVFAKNFVANISASPSVGYKNTSLKFYNSKEFISNINFDLISRLALVYNNGRYYAGTSLVSHTYSYNKPSLSIINGFGYLKVYAGFNFWRKK